MAVFTGDSINFALYNNVKYLMVSYSVPQPDDQNSRGFLRHLRYFAFLRNGRKKDSDI
jgi:hypothetical protein